DEWATSLTKSAARSGGTVCAWQALSPASLLVTMSAPALGRLCGIIFVDSVLENCFTPRSSTRNRSWARRG
ncbi:hypothetical protein, partial [Bradyrhizobium sp. 23AC]